MREQKERKNIWGKNYRRGREKRRNLRVFIFIVLVERYDESNILDDDDDGGDDDDYDGGDIYKFDLAT